MAKEVYISYGMSEQEIRKNFLDWVILGDNTPIDIAYKAEITDVAKTLYPIRVVLSEYQAEWSAFSIWEHKEEYKVSVPMVKYREVLTYNDDHTPSLTKIHVVTEEQYGNSNSMQRWPIIDRFNKTETKEKTVIDKQEQTQGSITGKYSQKVVLTEENNQDLNNWLDSFPLDDTVDRSDTVISDAKLKKLPENDEYAHSLLIPNIKSKAIDECKDEVPGNRYEDFSLDHLADNYDVDVYYLPVYEIAYKYNEQQFTVLLSGCVKDSAYSTDKPVDADLETKKKQLETELAARKSKRLKFGLIGFGVPPVLFLLFAILGLPSGFQIFMIFVEIAIAVFFIGFQFIPAHKKVKEQEGLLNTHLGNVEAKKQEILKIVNNDALSAEQQKEQIKKLIENQ